MTTTTNDILNTLDGTTKTSDIFKPFDSAASSARPHFEVHIHGTFVGRPVLLTSYDAGVTWFPLLTLDGPTVLGPLKTSRADALYKVSWDDAVTGDTGGYTSGSAKVFIGHSTHDSRFPFSLTKLLDKSGKMLGVTGNPLVVQSDQIATANAVISNGQSLSAAVDLGQSRLARIVVPASFEGTSLTFQVSPDGITYYNAYDNTGAEYAVPVGASRSVGLPPEDFLGVRYLKLRSGTSGAPTNVGAARTLTLALVP